MTGGPDPGATRRLPRRSPVDGLRRHGITPTEALAQSVAATAPCGAMAITPAIVVGAAGSGALVSFVVATAVCLSIAASVRHFATRMRATGGLYSYAARGFGPAGALLTGWSAVLGYATVSMAGLAATGLHLADLALLAGLRPGWAATTVAAGSVALAGVATWVLLRRGVRLSARVTLVVECVSIVLVVGVLAVLLVRVWPTADLAAAFAWDVRPDALAVGTVVAVSAFVGFESATTLGVETRRPLVSVPRAVSTTVPLAGTLYLFSTAVQSIAFTGTDAAGSGSGVPLADVVAAVGLPGTRAALDLCVAASYFGCTLASTSALVRVLFSMGRERVLPAPLGRTHPRFSTPATALAVVLPVIVCVPVLLVVLAHRDRVLADLLTLSAFGYLGSYLAVCVAAPLFLHRIGEATGRASALSWTTAAVVALTLGYAVLSYGSARPATAVAFIAAVVVGGALAVATARRSPGGLARVGVYDETVAADLARVARREGR